ncbi:MAG: HlyC/CorC family transporter [Pedosphaera sp.]|nr:HlyC/CorC family transporter [Pedosphaera sp.]
MDGDPLIAIGLKAVAVLLLVLLNGFFVAAEFAFVKIRETQLVTLIAKGHRGARIARRVIRNLDVSLSACQLGITLASLGLGWVGEPIFSDLLQPLWKPLGIENPQAQHTIAFLLGFSTITFLHITAGEQAPKWFAIQKPLPTALWVARPLEWFRIVSYPFIWALNRASLWLLRRLGIELAGEHEAHTEDELRLIFTTAQQRGGGTQLGHDIVLNAFDLRHRVVREVMRPRREISSLDTTAPIADCLDVAEKTRYSRLPLCDGGDLDKTLGVVHIKDLYAKRHHTNALGADLAPVARKIIFVPETTRLEKLLQIFLDRKLHFALVVDEFGGTVGMVTIENVLEELVGQIQDEFDQEKQLAVKTSERTWNLDGALPLHELAELVGEPMQGSTTVSGWVTYQRGGFPKVGDVIPCGSHQLQVEEMDGMRVSRLKLTRAELPDFFETGKEKRHD